MTADVQSDAFSTVTPAADDKMTPSATTNGGAGAEKPVENKTDAAEPVSASVPEKGDGAP